MTQSAVLNKNMDKAALGAQLRKDGIIIRTWDLMKTYVMGDQTIHAVAGVDIEIRKGEYVAIMGPSGSGKSTLMNLIGCLDSPSSGLYYLNGSLVSDMDDDELARIIPTLGHTGYDAAARMMLFEARNGKFHTRYRSM